MLEPGTSYSIPIATMGPIARRTVRRMGKGRVAAVFERSFYIECGKTFICIGVPELVLGPLTVLAAVPADMNWMSGGVRVGARVTGANGVVVVDGRFRFDTRESAEWSPSGIGRAEAIAVPIGPVLSVFRGSAPKDGLAPLLFRVEKAARLSPVVDAALPAHRELTDWVRRVTAGTDSSPPLESVSRMLGLGPGLTPSGDDYLGGMMIALRGFGYDRAVERLYAIIEREAPRRTNPISVAHLAAAREGWGSAPLHAVLNRLGSDTGASLAALISTVDRIGHTSGWDALTGLLAAVQAMGPASRDASRAA